MQKGQRGKIQPVSCPLPGWNQACLLAIAFGHRGYRNHPPKGLQFHRIEHNIIHPVFYKVIITQRACVIIVIKVSGVAVFHGIKEGGDIGGVAICETVAVSVVMIAKGKITGALQLV